VIFFPSNDVHDRLKGMLTEPVNIRKSTTLSINSLDLVKAPKEPTIGYIVFEISLSIVRRGLYNPPSSHNAQPTFIGLPEEGSSDGKG